MGELLERCKLSNLVNGNGLFEVYRNNSLYFFEKYKKSEPDIQAIPLSKIEAGRFFFFHYLDDSNWIKWSPTFVINVKQFENLKIIYAVNLNFVPFEVRTAVFDNIIVEKNFEKDAPLKVDFNGVYQRLKRYGFEYAICEYNMVQIKLCHKIHMNLVPRFLYSGHPKNKYDAKKLYSIWKAKIVNREKRDAEMMKMMVKDIYNVTDEISSNYDVLRGHIQRIQSSLEKYGRQS
jgi:hypothetical protein